MTENLYTKSFQKEQKLMTLKISLGKKQTLTCQNSKTEQSFKWLLKNCNGRTEVCSRYCYACRGPISWENSVGHAVAVSQWIEENGVEAAAKRISTEIRWKGTFRWMDRGDFCETTVKLANRVAELRPDVVFCAYTRQLWAAKALSPELGIVFSVDRTTTHLVNKVPCYVKIAYLKELPDEVIPEEVDIVHPVNKRKALLGDKRDCSFSRKKAANCAWCLRCFAKPGE